MSLRCYSTTEVPQKEQFEYWNDAICEVFTQLHSEPAGANQPKRLGYKAQLESWDIGDIQLSKVSASPSNVTHGKTHVAASNDDVDLIHLQLSGVSLNKQNGNETILKPGEFTICDSQTPYSVSFKEAMEMIVLRLPSHLMSKYLKAGQSLYGSQLMTGSHSGTGNLFVNHLLQLWRYRQNPWSAAELYTVSAASLALLGGHLDSIQSIGRAAMAIPNSETDQLNSIKLYIEQNLRDHDLTAEQVAGEHNICSRTLRSKFALEGTTFSQYILERRLLTAKTLLANPQFRTLKMIDVALMCGFQSPAHFSNRFNERFGVSPSEYRFNQFQNA